LLHRMCLGRYTITVVRAKFTRGILPQKTLI